MAIDNINRNNTIDQWRIQTNQSANALNTLETGDYTKSNGTLTLNSDSKLVITANGTSLQVSNTVLFQTRLEVGNTIALGVRESGTGNLTVGSSLQVLGTGTALFVANNAQVNNNLQVTNTLTTGAVNANNNVTVGRNLLLTSTGNVIFANTGSANIQTTYVSESYAKNIYTNVLDVDNYADVGANLAVGTSIDVGTFADIGSYTLVGSFIQTGSYANVGTFLRTASNVAVGSYLDVASNANIGTTLVVAGNTTAQNFNTSGVANSQTLRVVGAGTIGGTLDVTGNTTAQNFNTSGVANSQTLRVVGAGTIGSTLDVTGNTTSGNLLTTGVTNSNTLIVVTSATVGTTLTVTGNTTAQNFNTSGVANSQTLRVVGAGTIGGTLGVTGDTTLTGDLAVNGGDLTTNQTTFNLLNTNATTLNIGGNTTRISIGNATSVSTNTTISGNLFVNSNTTTGNGGIIFANILRSGSSGAIGTSLSVGTSATVGTTLTVTGNTTTGNLNTSGVANSQTLRVVGAGTIGGTLGVTGDTTITGDLAVNGGDLITNQGTFNLLNDTVTNINVGGNTTRINIGNTTSVSTNTTISGNLFVNSNTTTGNGGIIFANILRSGSSGAIGTSLSVGTSGSIGTSLTVGTTLTVTGNTTTGNLNTSGVANSETLRVNSSATIGSTLGVTGRTTLSSDLAINGGNVTTTSATMNVFNANVTTIIIGGNTTRINIGNATSVSTNTTISGNLVVSGNTTTGNGGVVFAKDLDIIRSAKIGTTLDVTGIASFASDVDITGKLEVSGAFITSGDVLNDTENYILSSISPVTSGFASFQVNRGEIPGSLPTAANANASLRWGESVKQWAIRDVNNPDSASAYSRILTANTISNTVTDDSSATVPNSFITKTLNDRLNNLNTSQVAESTTSNLWLTAARVRSNISSTTGFAGYNSETGVITIPGTTDHINEATTGNLWFTAARVRSNISAALGRAEYNITTGVITIPGTTAHINEATTSNLWFTAARVRANVSNTAPINYNSTTGDFSHATSGVVAKTYASDNTIPIITVNSTGHVTDITNVTIRSASTTERGIVQLQDSITSTSTSNAATANSVKTAYDTLNTIKYDKTGGTISGDVTVTGNVNVNKSVIITDNLTVNKNVVISGNLTVSGNITYANTQTLLVGDNIITLNADWPQGVIPTENAGIEVNRGNVPEGSGGGGNTYIRWDESIDFWVANNGTSTGEYRIANSTTYLAEGTNLYLTAARVRSNISASAPISYDSGTGVVSHATSGVSAGTYANASHVPVVAVNSTGHVTGVTNVTIAISASQIDSGTLPIGRGGTNQTSFNTGNLIFFNGTSLVSIANTANTSNTHGSASQVPVIITDPLGRVTGVTNTTISIDTSNIGSGTLPIGRGGTNQTSFTTGNLIFFNGTSLVSIANTANTSNTHGSASQVPVIVTDPLGRITGVTNTAIAIAAGAVSGLAASATTDTSNASNISTGTLNAARLPTTGTAATYGSASIIPVFTTDQYGRVTNVVNNAVAIGAGAVSGLAASATTDTTNAANISSGVLNVSRLPTTGTAGTYANNWHIPVITTDAYGRVSGVTNTAIRTSSTSQTGIVQLNDTVTSTSTTLAATANAVNAVHTIVSSINQTVGTTSNVQFRTLGVNTTADSANIGSIRATGAITSFFSDERLKEDIVIITNALDKVNSIRGVHYTPNDVAVTYGYRKDRKVGVIAQDIEKVLPEVVVTAPFDIDENGGSKSGENYKTVQYDRIIPLLIEAIKELSIEVEDLKKQINK